MKIRKFNKRLNLNKTTIVNLDDAGMSAVYGGAITDPGVCVRTLDITKCASNCLCIKETRDFLSC